MVKKSKKQIIDSFIKHYFQTRKRQYLKKEIENSEALVKFGILSKKKEDNKVLEVVGDNFNLQEAILKIAETKLKKKLPANISGAFQFINEFDDALKKEYKCEKIINSFELVKSGMQTYALYYLNKKGVKIIEFLFSLEGKDKREPHTLWFERSFFNFLPYSNYSENEIVEIIDKLSINKDKGYFLSKGLRDLPRKNFEKSKSLLKYCQQNNVATHLISDLLIGLYNTEDSKNIELILEHKKKDLNSFLWVLGRINYKNKKDLETAFSQIGDLEYKDLEVSYQQSYLIRNIIESEYSTEILKKKAFKLYEKFLKNASNEIIDRVISDVKFLHNNEADKYGLLHLYLSKTKNFNIISEFFIYFEDPRYIFDLMMKLFTAKPDYLFSINLFENNIQENWSTKQEETEMLILDLFKQHSSFGILGAKIIMSLTRFSKNVDLLKLNKGKYQINAINSISSHPLSFDKLLPIILPLRNSKLKGVRDHLQRQLAQMVFDSYHDTLYNQIKDIIGKNKRDQDFLSPIKQALDEYHKLKNLKESINDLNPFENERDLIDLYFRLEHESQTKMMNEVNSRKGTFMELFKNVTIVRGNSWMVHDGEIHPLGKYESKMLVDGSSYLNPDLYEHNLNTKG